jgi:hypothetical protein
MPAKVASEALIEDVGFCEKSILDRAYFPEFRSAAEACYFS